MVLKYHQLKRRPRDLNAKHEFRERKKGKKEKENKRILTPNLMVFACTCRLKGEGVVHVLMHTTHMPTTCFFNNINTHTHTCYNQLDNYKKAFQ